MAKGSGGTRNGSSRNPNGVGVRGKSWSDNVVSLNEKYDKAFQAYINASNKASEDAMKSPEGQALRELQTNMELQARSGNMSDSEAQIYFDREDELNAAVTRVENRLIKEYKVEELGKKQQKAFKELDKFIASDKGLDEYRKLRRKKNPTAAERNAMEIFSRITYNPD